jgi:hypothetical protein
VPYALCCQPDNIALYVAGVSLQAFDEVDPLPSDRLLDPPLFLCFAVSTLHLCHCRSLKEMICCQLTICWNHPVFSAALSLSTLQACDCRSLMEMIC